MYRELEEAFQSISQENKDTVYKQYPPYNPNSLEGLNNFIFTC